MNGYNPRRRFEEEPLQVPDTTYEQQQQWTSLSSDFWGNWDLSVPLQDSNDFVPIMNSAAENVYGSSPEMGAEFAGQQSDEAGTRATSGYMPALAPESANNSHDSEALYLPIDIGNLERDSESLLRLNDLSTQLEQPSFGHEVPSSTARSYDSSISNARRWFTYQSPSIASSGRSLPRRRSIYRGNTTHHMFIPSPRGDEYTGLDPMQRWQNSPPEDDSMSMAAIAQAVANTDMRARSRRHSGPRGSRNTSSHSRRAPSVSSIGSAASSRSNVSKTSLNSAMSSNDGASNAPRVKKPRQRVKVAKTDERLFQCTFCCDTFKSKYDWTRHEKSLHLVLESWNCTPQGGVVTNPLTGDATCAYCSAPGPTLEHLQSHSHQICAVKAAEHRRFRRKDHLNQHLKLVHGIDRLPHIDEWKSERTDIRSRCGFCDASMQTWKERAQHLSDHFRKGKKMDSWQGTHGFDADVEAEVTNSVPPYLLGHESRTPVPYSATNPHSRDHFI